MNILIAGSKNESLSPKLLIDNMQAVLDLVEVIFGQDTSICQRPDPIFSALNINKPQALIKRQTVIQLPQRFVGLRLISSRPQCFALFFFLALVAHVR